jgi:hypothetical protein
MGSCSLHFYPKFSIIFLEIHHIFLKKVPYLVQISLLTSYPFEMVSFIIGRQTNLKEPLKLILLNLHGSIVLIASIPLS